MNRVTGNLFSIFDSTFRIAQADISDGTISVMFIYASSSDVYISDSVIANMNFGDVGGLAVVTAGSEVLLEGVSLINMTSTEAGLINVQGSVFSFISSSISNFNNSFLTAQQSTISIVGTEVSDGHIATNNLSLSLLPSGGLLSCVDCPQIYIQDSNVTGVSAKEGGVIYLTVAQTSSGNIEITNSRFENCLSKTYGGVLSSYSYAIQIQNCVFTNNSASSGGAINFNALDLPFKTFIERSNFSRNSAEIDASCLRWVGTRPVNIENVFINNSAIYGNPEASTPQHLQLLDSQTLQQVTAFPIIGVTGQKMEESLIVGVFDALGQLILTDNSSLIVMDFPNSVNVSGSTEVLAMQGLANFSVLFSPYSVGLISLTFFSQTENIANVTIPYQFRDCVPGEIRRSDGCYSCPKNSYSFNPNDSACHLCPPMGDCYGLADMRIEADYWRSNQLTDQIYQCMNRDACLGGLNSDCGVGYTGVLCGVCADHYYKFGMWDCRNCDNEVPPAGRGVLVALIVLGAVSIPSQLYMRTEGLWFNFALVFRVLMNYAQIMLFVVLLHVQWPLVALVNHEVMRVIGSLGAVFLYSECQYAYLDIYPFYMRLISTAFYPFLLIFASAVVWAVVELKKREGMRKTAQRIVSSALIAVSSFIPMLTLMSLSMFQCQELDNATWLVSELDQKCWTGKHLFYLLSVALPLLIFTFLAYLCIIYLLHSSVQRNPFIDLKTYFQTGFKPAYQNWELFVMFRNFLLMLLSLAYPHLDKYSHIIFFSCIIGICIQVELKTMPYSGYWLNVLNLTSQTAAFVIVYTSANASADTLSAISCLCSLIVVSLGVVTLLHNRLDKSKFYAVKAVEDFSEDSRAHLQRGKTTNDYPLMDESGSIDPPPSTPVGQIIVNIPST